MCLLLIDQDNLRVLTTFFSWNSFWTIAPVIGIGLFDRLIGKENGNDMQIHTDNNCRLTRSYGSSRALSLRSGRKVVWYQVVCSLHAGRDLSSMFAISMAPFLFLTELLVCDHLFHHAIRLCNTYHPERWL